MTDTDMLYMASLEKRIDSMETVLKSVKNHLSFLLDCEIESSSNRSKTESMIKEIEKLTGGRK